MARTGGHRERLTKMVREKRKWLVRFVRRRMKDVTDAEDVAQETFERIWKYGDLTKVENPTAYMAKVAFGIIAEIRKRAGAQPLESLTDEMLNALHTDPDELLNSLNFETVTEEDLVRLPLRHREVFKLACEGCTYEEVATRSKLKKFEVERYLIEARTVMHPSIERAGGRLQAKQEKGRK